VALFPLRDPPLLVDLSAPGHAQSVGGHIVSDAGAGCDIGIVAYRHRRDKLGTAADEDAVADGGAVFLVAVIVAGDGAGSNVDAGADRGVTQVAEMVRL